MMIIMCVTVKCEASILLRSRAFQVQVRNTFLSHLSFIIAILSAMITFKVKIIFLIWYDNELSDNNDLEPAAIALEEVDQFELFFLFVIVMIMNSMIMIRFTRMQPGHPGLPLWTPPFGAVASLERIFGHLLVLLSSWDDLINNIATVLLINHHHATITIMIRTGCSWEIHWESKPCLRPWLSRSTADSSPGGQVRSAI